MIIMCIDSLHLVAEQAETQKTLRFCSQIFSTSICPLHTESLYSIFPAFVLVKMRLIVHLSNANIGVKYLQLWTERYS